MPRSSDGYESHDPEDVLLLLQRVVGRQEHQGGVENTKNVALVIRGRLFAKRVDKARWCFSITDSTFSTCYASARKHAEKRL